MKIYWDVQWWSLPIDFSYSFYTIFTRLQIMDRQTKYTSLPLFLAHQTSYWSQILKNSVLYLDCCWLYRSIKSDLFLTKPGEIYHYFSYLLKFFHNLNLQCIFSEFSCSNEVAYSSNFESGVISRVVLLHESYLS